MKVLGSQTFKHVGLTNHIKHLIQGMVKNKTGQNEIQYILKNTYKMVDISGYALSSQRGYIASLSYIYNIMIAKKYNIPIILFPQSFGPFNYRDSHKKVLIPLMQEYLPYPEKIYARKGDGIAHLKIFNLPNVQRTFDSVL